MKKMNIAILALIALNFAVTGAFLAVLPDTVPAHYNFAGEIDRMGSKYEYLAFPICAALLGLFMMWSAKKLTKAPSEQKVLGITGIIIEVMFGAMSCYFMIKGMSAEPSEINTGSSPETTVKLVTIVLGALMTVCGFFMPSAKRNFIFGIRTSWTLSNDTVWRRTHRFGGILAVIAGLLMIAASFVPDAFTGIYLSLGILIVWAIVCIVASKVYHSRENNAVTDGAEVGDE